MAREVRRVGFHLPPEVFEQLLDEYMYCDETEREEGFWERLRSYYELSPLQGDSVICHPSFIHFIAEYDGTDPPAWVSEQSTLKKMQCFILAGPTRGQDLLETLQQIERMRSDNQDESDEVPFGSV